MTSFMRVRRLEKVLLDWFKANAPWMEIDDGLVKMTVEIDVHDPTMYSGSTERFSIHSLAEELDMALDGILADEIAAGIAHEMRVRELEDE